MHKGMLMAIEKSRIINNWKISDIKKVKRFINQIEKLGSVKFSKHNIRDTDELWVEKDFLYFSSKTFNINRYEHYNFDNYCMKLFSKYLEMALPILELKYDIVNIGNVKKCTEKGWWSIEINKNEEKERLLKDCYKYIKFWDETCFEIYGGSDFIDKMCLKIGDRYFNPFYLK